MAGIVEIETPRLRMRRWRDSDREPYAAMNVDPRVMEFFPALQDRATSDASIDYWMACFDERGWSNWAAGVGSSVNRERGRPWCFGCP